MTRRTKAVVSIDEDGDGGVLSSDVAETLDVEGGDAVAIRGPSGERATVLASVEASLSPGSISAGPAVARECGVESGDQVIVERISPATARRVTVAPVPGLSVRGGESTVREAIGDAPVSAGEELEVSFFDGSLTVPVRITETAPSGPVVVDAETSVDLETGPAAVVGGPDMTPLGGETVGGYDETVEALRSAVVRPLRSGNRPEGSGRAGVVVAGGAGVGKTHLVRHAAWLADAAVHPVDASRLVEGGHATVEEELGRARRAVSGDGRSIVHVDALDAILGSGRDRTALQVREWLRGFADRDDVVVVGEARDAAALPEVVLGGDLLSREVTVPRPDAADRAAVLSVAMEGVRVGSGVDLEEVGRRAFGYVAGDLLALRSRAVDAAVDRVESGDEDRVVLQGRDVDAALADTSPQGIPADDAGVPETSFEDIGGLEAAKRELVRAVEWPLYHAEWFDRVGVDPPSGVLLYGPPGTGKTMLARAVASTTDANFLSVNGPELMNKYVGESERAVRTVFEQARAAAPTVVFFDEIDGLGATRATDSETSAPERVVSQLLTEMDGLGGSSEVTVVGATNRPERLDSALLRPGRFDKVVAVQVPTRAERREIFEVHARDRPVDDLDFDDLARRTDGFTGSDIAAVMREAGMVAIEERIEGSGDATAEEIRIRPRHVEHGLETVGPSVSEEQREYYESVRERLDQGNPG